MTTPEVKESAPITPLELYKLSLNPGVGCSAGATLTLVALVQTIIHLVKWTFHTIQLQSASRDLEVEETKLAQIKERIEALPREEDKKRLQELERRKTELNETLEKLDREDQEDEEALDALELQEQERDAKLDTLIKEFNESKLTLPDSLEETINIEGDVKRVKEKADRILEEIWDMEDRVKAYVERQRTAFLCEEEMLCQPRRYLDRPVERTHQFEKPRLKEVDRPFFHLLETSNTISQFHFDEEPLFDELHSDSAGPSTDKKQQLKQAIAERNKNISKCEKEVYIIDKQLEELKRPIEERQSAQEETQRKIASIKVSQAEPEKSQMNASREVISAFSLLVQGVILSIPVVGPRALWSYERRKTQRLN